MSKERKALADMLKENELYDFLVEKGLYPDRRIDVTTAADQERRFIQDQYPYPLPIQRQDFNFPISIPDDIVTDEAPSNYRDVDVTQNDWPHTPPARSEDDGEETAD